MCIWKVSKRISLIWSLVAIALSLIWFFSGKIVNQVTANDHLNILWTERTILEQEAKDNTIAHAEIKKDVAVIQSDTKSIKDDVIWIKNFLLRK